MKSVFRSLYNRISSTPALLAQLRHEQSTLQTQLEDLQIATGVLLSRSLVGATLAHLYDAEFKVFSQSGEDGIIQYLLQHVPVENQRFVELGVEDYRESNTRFLLAKDHWSGLIVDSGIAHLEFLRTSPYGWRYDLEAQSSFITRENINSLIDSVGIKGDIGLLSIDLDGMDYWIWEALTVVSPRIIIVEYNSLFGVLPTVAVPYTPDFNLFKAHYSGIYWGASLAAFCHLAEQRGYQLVGCNRQGYNAFFVRNDVMNGLQAVTPQQGYVASKLRTLRDQHGQVNRAVTRESHLHLISQLPVFDVHTGKMLTVGDLSK